MGSAITRQVSPALGDCLLSHLPRQPIDVALARRQHAAYERLLVELGFDVRSLPAEPDLPTIFHCPECYRSLWEGSPENRNCK